MNWIKQTIFEINMLSNTISKQKQFGFLVLAVLLFLFVRSYYNSNLIFNSKQIALLISISIVLSFILCYPKWLKLFLVIWLFIGRLLGEISSFLLLSIIYFLVLFPVILVRNLFLKKESTKTGWILKNNSTIDYKKLH